MLSRYRKAREEGFTLVELLVVVVIIAVIAAIAVPIFLNQKKKAEVSAAQASVSAISDAIAAAQSTGGTVQVTAAQITAVDGTGASQTVNVPASVGSVRVEVDPDAAGSNAPLDGVAVVSGTTLTGSAWCVSADNPTGGVISMVNGATAPNLSGSACYAGAALTPALTDSGTGGGASVSAPSAPTAVTATAGNAQATVSWTAPASDGGAAITGYTASSTPSGGTCTWVSGPLSCTATGLTNGTTYTFAVTAMNSAGTSTASGSSLSVAPVAPVTAPGAPSGVTATSSSTQAVVSWTAPASNGGATITGYAVTSSPGSKTCAWASGPLNCTVTGLTNGTGYTFTVTATNSAGTGSASAPSSSVTPAAALPIVTGGSVSYSGAYTVRKFTSNGTLQVQGGSVPMDYLIVGGGGSAGAVPSGGVTYPMGGGGGGGGLVQGTNLSVSTGSYSIVIGAGGALNNYGQNGGDSTFNGITAYGGGSGVYSGQGNAGGSGGGGGVTDGNGTGHHPEPGGVAFFGGTQGHNGGDGYKDGDYDPHNAGGGGGAGSAGLSFNAGNGLSSSITGSSVYYAAGGVGYMTEYDGGCDCDIQTSGTVGTGGAGLGVGGTANIGNGAGAMSSSPGGSGIVVVRYLTALAS